MPDYLLQIAPRGNGGQGGECRHAASQIVRKRFADATVHLTRQCRTCGAQIGAWLKQDLYARAGMPWWNPDPQQQWRDRKQLRLPL